jgi:hypothetical protein
LWRASKATDGSVARSYGPGGFVYGVIPGRTPLVHERPLLVDVAKPMPVAPPSVKTPSMATATIVEPAENVSGSTTVACWPPWVKGSERMSLLPFAEAPADRTSAATATSARTRVSLLGFMMILASRKGERPACAGLSSAVCG